MHTLRLMRLNTVHLISRNMFHNIKSKVGIFILLLACFTSIQAHSWLACVDYTEKDAGTYDHARCRGYARNAKSLAPNGGDFGQDKGFDYHPSQTKPCRDERSDGLYYDANHPKAVYYPGQQVVLAHPMKNHGSDTCTNGFIPDNGNFIYRGSKNAASDSTLSGFQQNLVADLGIKDSSLPLGQYPRPGYQNAPLFCDNTDRSLGTYSFNVPADLEAGEYTFVWIWAFNSAQDLYSTCFEVEIVETVAERNSKLLANGFSDFYEPCGGSTSKSGVNGNTNPGCTPSSGGTTTTTTAISTASSTTTTTTTTTSTPTNSQNLIVNANQIAGYINLEAAEAGVIRRYLKLDWECPGIEVKFWDARVTSKTADDKGVSYELLQEGTAVATGKVSFHASLGLEGCNQMSYPPRSTLIKDE